MFLSKTDGAVLLFDVERQGVDEHFVSDLERSFAEIRHEFNADCSHMKVFENVPVVPVPWVLPGTLQPDGTVICAAQPVPEAGAHQEKKGVDDQDQEEPDHDVNQVFKAVRSGNTVALFLALAKVTDLVLERRDNIPRFHFRRFGSHVSKVATNVATSKIVTGTMSAVTAAAVLPVFHVVGGAVFGAGRCYSNLISNLVESPGSAYREKGLLAGAVAGAKAATAYSVGIPAAAALGAVTGPWFFPEFWFFLISDHND